MAIASKTNNDLLAYESSTDLWKNKSFGTLGLLTSADLTGYATESWVTSGFYPLSGNPLGFLDSATADTLYYSIGNPSGFITYYNADQAYYPLSGNPSSFLVASDIAGKANLASPTLTGVPLSTTAAVDTNTTQIATTAYVIGQGYLKSATASSTYYLQTNPDNYITSAALSGYATESFVTSQGYITSSALTPYLTTATAASTYFTIASAANKADLASPTFTGTPSLPTGTTAVTQTAGNNTTAVATTAFVTAAVPTVANIAQARGFNNTANFLSPQMANWLMMSPNIIDITRVGFSVTNTGTITTTNTGWITSYTRTGTAGACSSRWRTFGFSQVDQVWSMTEKQNPTSHFNFSNASWCSGRSVLIGITESVFSWGFYHGKAEGDGVGVLVRRGYGWRATGGAGTRYLSLEVHNGTTLTSVTSTYAVPSVAFDWDLISDGAGTVTLYVNGTQVATTTGGPTGLVNLTPAVWQEEVATSAASTSPYNGMAHSRGKFIAFDPS